ncbi:sigma-70 family RNA polymerase sigma factor [Thermomonospora umbrina]|uniref:RNA polymerase sigma-70 factor (ECF subfamily) n=1 Tax=Thermomonospora umbrina TaxID=111806 RepID=A0A3D9SMD3_9ACTN|nr:sigma-70 family RNA polymerase sigma factor [Thermomonospora umbrina]REE97008.1 RNA polymerase sigma-70 factor (ECF subfamily) [Thermomonospora umbrina]
MSSITRQDEQNPVEAWWARHHGELTGYCYRMLGSAFDADDAVQETLVRAWRHVDRFDEDRGTARAWLFAIATNVCLDMLRGAERRARAIDLGPASQPGDPLGAPLAESTWVLPIPDGRVRPDGADPADLVAARETIRLAFVAALQHLPPRQRAVLILRDVLSWRASEVARLLDVTVTAVNSALQRARATLRALGPVPGDPFDPLDDGQRHLLDAYCTAFERHDVERLVSLLHEDATMSMPPFTWWLRGREDIRRALSAPDVGCLDSRLVPVAANGTPAFAHYVPSANGFEARGLVLVDVADGLITGTTSFLDTARLFPLFSLPTDEFPGSASYQR